MNTFSNIAYVPKAMDNMFMGDLPFDTNVFRLLCDIFEDDPTEFHEHEDFAFMTTNTKDIKTGEILYAWFTLNRNSGATQKWYNSDFKTKSELEELGLINSNKKTEKIVSKEDTKQEPNIPQSEQTVNKIIKVTKSVSKAFIEKFPKDETAKNELLKIQLIPDQDAIKWIYSENKTFNCSICTISVEPDWIHFDDFVEHGLIEFWDYCFTCEHRCMLILQNINQTLIKTALTPLLDVINNNRPQLPFSKFAGCPNNISIFGTLLPPENKMSIPLDIDFIRCCDILTRKPDFTIDTLKELFCKEK